MEFALPFALRLFPNLLPSTFEEKHQVTDDELRTAHARHSLSPHRVTRHQIEEKRKNLLKVRLRFQRRRRRGRGAHTA